MAAPGMPHVPAGFVSVEILYVVLCPLRRIPRLAKRLHRDLRNRSKRNRHPYRAPAPRFAIEVERPVQLEHALSHIDQPQPSRFFDLPGGAANAIIGD